MTVMEKPQATIERLAKRKSGFTSVELAQERGKPANLCGPFERSIKAAVKSGTIVATGDVRDEKTVYKLSPTAGVEQPKKAKKPAVAKKVRPKKQQVSPDAMKALNVVLERDAPANELLGNLFDSLAAICRRMG